MSDDVGVWPAHRLAAAIRARTFSSRELLDHYLNRIDRFNGPLNAVVTLDAERATEAAAAADAATAHGETLGPLHGLPITIKDAIETAGLRSTGGATELSDHVPDSDAPAVAQLKAAGAVVFGKTNLPRWSGDLQSYNEIFGTTNNPWNVERVPGGSSGGAATAVACGFTAFELGTDIGGSVRIPSHFCGVFGLKPTFGLVPQRGYLDHVGGGITDADINVFGPIARSAEDLDLLLRVLAAPEPSQAAAWRVEPPETRLTSLSDCRIGVWIDEATCPIDADYRALISAATYELAGAGAKVEEAHPPVDFTYQVRLFSARVGAAIAPSLPDDVAEGFGGSHREWLRNAERRAELQSTWRAWFDQYDALLCPVTPTAAFEHDQSGDFTSRTLDVNGEKRPYLDNVSWTGLIGVLGLPSAVPPIGRTPDGLPVGLQVVTPWFRDRDAVKLAGLIAEACGGGYDVPPTAG